MGRRQVCMPRTLSLATWLLFVPAACRRVASGREEHGEPCIGFGSTRATLYRSSRRRDGVEQFLHLVCQIVRWLARGGTARRASAASILFVFFSRSSKAFPGVPGSVPLEFDQ